MSETLTTMLAAMPDGYQKTVGFPTYDLLAAASIPMEELAEELARTREMLDPSTLTGTDLDNYIKSRSGLVRNPATCASGVLQVTGTGTITAGDSLSPAAASSLPPRRRWRSRAAVTWPSVAPRRAQLETCPPAA